MVKTNRSFLRDRDIKREREIQREKVRERDKGENFGEIWRLFVNVLNFNVKVLG